MSTDAALAAPPEPSRRRRMTKVLAWFVGIALFLVVLDVAGVDVRGWIENLFDEIQAMPTGYMAAALVFQTGQVLFAGLSYYGILKFAYKDEVELWPILAAYAVGIAMNGFLPANLGTFVTLVMFVAIIPSCGFPGALAAYLVQKIFFVIAGTFVYLYMFLSVPGSFDLSLGRLHDHPVAAILIVAGVIVLLVVLVRIFWRKVKGFWEQAKQGGAIVTEPKKYFARVFLPSFLSWTCRLVVTGIFLAAFAIPVTFESVMWVTGSGSLANVASFTPGAIGVTQATNALALKTCCDVPQSVAVDYSTAQQLIVTAWNILLAMVVVVFAFGWTGGKQLVGASYTDAKVRSAEMKEEHKEKKAQKKEAKRQKKLSE